MSLKNFFKRKKPADAVNSDIIVAKKPKISLSSCKEVNSDKDRPHEMNIEIDRELKENLGEKYKPKSSSDLLGNKTSILSLRSWLENWNKVHIKKTKKVPYTKQNPGAKSALLSGPPGIGKTSAAHLVAKELGFEVFEMNASDARSKRLIQEKVADILNNSTICFEKLTLNSPRHRQKSLGNKKVIIMDEVDGMSSDDRGGIQELIKLIKTTKVPIICICNDRVKSNVRSLANHCFDLRFQRPNRLTVKKYLQKVCAQEEINISEGDLENLITSSSGDIRQLINSLNLMNILEGHNKNMNSMKKDSVLSIDHSTATQFIFNESQKPDKYKLRYDAFFVSYDLIPLLIADHYPTAVRNHYKLKAVNSNEGALESLDSLVKASDCVALADIYSTEIMKNQRWSLLPLAGAINLGAAMQAKGKIGFAGFPTWLGKFSSQRKKQRLLQGLELHLRQFAPGVSSKDIRLERLGLLKKLALEPILQNGKEGITKALDNMNQCGLSRDDVVETFSELSLESVSGLSFDKLDAKIKREFTRRYKKNFQKSQLLAREAEVKERRIKKK